MHTKKEFQSQLVSAAVQMCLHFNLSCNTDKLYIGYNSNNQIILLIYKLLVNVTGIHLNLMIEISI